MNTEIKGHVEQITYASEETGYAIVKISVPDFRHNITAVGNIANIQPGETVLMKGAWTVHPRYGRQFKVESYETMAPSTVKGIEKYLSSGLIKGLGSVMAKRIVERFGENTLNIIDDDPARLSEIEGIGDVRVAMIKKAWEEQMEVRNVMVFLQSYDISTGYAFKIFKQYGNDAIRVVKENPFRLATEISGIGFAIADRISEKMGLPKESPQRVESGIIYVLRKMTEEGHVYSPYSILIERSSRVLQVDRELVEKALSSVAFEGKVIIEDINWRTGEFRENNKAVYLPRFYHSEKAIAMHLQRIIEGPGAFKQVEPEEALGWCGSRISVSLARMQKQAVRTAVLHKAMIITGGPGTGKTTIIKAILEIFSRIGINVFLAAPTGRAAKRMTETTGREAKTIHRMLKYNPRYGIFEADENNPLDCGMVVIDEASMIDNFLMFHLLSAIPSRASIIIVGDVNQLPSVSSGNVLKDIIDSHTIPVVELDEIFRQAKQSQIVVNAHRVNNGMMPAIKAEEGNCEDFYFIERNDSEDVLKVILELVSERIPSRFGFDPFSDIQVITPMHRGMAGTERLNLELQDTLNPRMDGITRGSYRFRVNDKVMQVKNNYDLDVFNGDIGIIKSIDTREQRVMISFDGRMVAYDFSGLDEIMLAYAVSVHKSQGSEFPAVVMPVLTEHYIMLQRNLIYTAMTRGKKLVVMVGSRKALNAGINNNKPRQRYTCLKDRLIELFNEG